MKRPTFHEWYNTTLQDIRRSGVQPEVNVHVTPTDSYLQKRGLESTPINKWGADSVAEVSADEDAENWVVWTYGTNTAPGLRHQGFGSLVSNAAANIAANAAFAPGDTYMRYAEVGNADWLTSQGYKLANEDPPNSLDPNRDEDDVVEVSKTATVQPLKDTFMALAGRARDVSTRIQMTGGFTEPAVYTIPALMRDLPGGSGRYRRVR